MINLLYNQCRWQETFQIFNRIPGIVTYSNGNAFYEIQLRNIIYCTVIFRLDKLHYKNFDVRRGHQPLFTKMHNLDCDSIHICTKCYLDMYKHMIKNHRIHNTQSCVITKVHDLLGQPS